MQSVDAVLRQAASDLEAIGARWAVIGGLAVAFRAEPRFTKDVDLAVAVADDQEAEGIVNACRSAVTRSPRSSSRTT
jgi:Nucleotidyl transferase AbiEii toxin, Type IV TA system